MKGRSTRFLPTFILALVSLASSLVVAEFVLRRAIQPPASRSQDFRIPHPVFGWVLEAGASYVNRKAGASFPVSYNARGWRDVDHELRKPDGVFRILVLGDSYMEGYSVDLEDSFHRRLGARAGAAGFPVEVVNLGVGGYGSLQEYLVLTERGWLYDPDLVLLGFLPGNDLRNNCLELESIVKTGMKVRSRPFLAPGPRGEWQITRVDFEGARRRYEKKRAERRRPLHRLAEYSAVVRASIQASNRIEDLLESRATGDRNFDEVKERRRQLALFGHHYCSTPPEFAQAWEITSRVLSRLKDESDRHGVPLLVFSVPGVIEVDPAARDAAMSEALEPERLCLEQVPGFRRLAGLLSEIGIEFVDLLPAFREAVRERGLEPFGATDTHWNRAGHDLAARIVLEELVARGLLPRAPR